MTIAQILEMPIDKLESMSDAELKELLGDLIPKAREPDKAVMADNAMELANRVKKMLNI